MKSDEAIKRRSDEGREDGRVRSPYVASSLHRSVASHGFTLIEVLMTMVLLGILVPVIMEGLSLSLHAASSSRHRTEAANLAQDELNQLIASGQWNSNPQGSFGDDHPDYTWACQSAEQDYGVSEVQLTVAWNEQGQPRQLVISTFTQTSPTLPGTDTTTQ
jgi:prepilin-type N-terminal cleavage/methylation domain-containing protein